jgi:hypothetical protein
VIDKPILSLQHPTKAPRLCFQRPFCEEASNFISLFLPDRLLRTSRCAPDPCTRATGALDLLRTPLVSSYLYSKDDKRTFRHNYPNEDVAFLLHHHPRSIILVVIIKKSFPSLCLQTAKTPTKLSENFLLKSSPPWRTTSETAYVNSRSSRNSSRARRTTCCSEPNRVYVLQRGSMGTKKAWAFTPSIHPLQPWVILLAQVRNPPRGPSGFTNAQADANLDRMIARYALPLDPSTTTLLPVLSDIPPPKPLVASAGDPRGADMESSSCRDAIRQPFRTDYLPKPAVVDEPLFIPADARRVWYTGWLEPWENFREIAHNSWDNQATKIAFDEIKGDVVDAPRVADPTVGEDIQGAVILEDHFRREVFEVVGKIYGKLLATTAMQEAGSDTIPAGISTVNPADLLPGALSAPKFAVYAIAGDGEEEGMRLVGHAEYLGGRRGALTWAVKENAKNSLGSLRCVLGTSLLSYPR